MCEQVTCLNEMEQCPLTMSDWINVLNNLIQGHRTEVLSQVSFLVAISAIIISSFNAYYKGYELYLMAIGIAIIIYGICRFMDVRRKTVEKYKNILKMIIDGENNTNVIRKKFYE